MPDAKVKRASFAYRQHGVVRVNDDGRQVVLRTNLDVLTAEQLAGRERDMLSDEAVGQGWNVVAMRVKPGKAFDGHWDVRDPKTKGRPGVPKPRRRQYAAHP
jgi:hypothetical protein